MSNHHLRKACRICGTPRPTIALNFPATPIGDAYEAHPPEHAKTRIPLEVFLCENCGLAQLLHIVEPDHLYANFIYKTTISHGLSKHFATYAEHVVTLFHLTKNSFILDIGSNDGTLLREFKAKNMTVCGCEPARHLAEASQAHGIPTIPDYFSANIAATITSAFGIPNVITSNNTLANIDDLHDFVSTIKLLLTDKNVFIFETGNLLDIVSSGLFDTIYHEHLSYFSVTSLCYLFKQHGLSLFRVESIPTKGGSIRGFVGLDTRTQDMDDSVKQHLTLEENLALKTTQPFNTLSNRLAAQRRALLDRIHSIINDEKTVAGYGASVGVTTFLFYLGITNEIDYLFDDNPDKFDLFSPGKNIQVKDSSQIYSIRPHFIIIFAWRYSEIIIEKHSAYLKQGGKFIIPWPKLIVVG